MAELDTDIVLSAIRRGEDSLPKLRAATGLDYAKLHPVLHKLEYEWRSIDSTETASGFQRFTPRSNEKSNGRPKPDQSTPVTSPQAFKQTSASVSARDIGLLQRDAPYCVQCRGLCFFDGLDLQSQPHWRCKPCGLTFEGSSEQVVEMAHIDPSEEVRAPRHEDLGPEEEDVIENMRHRNPRTTLGAEEEAALALMRGGELPEGEARIAEEIDREIVAVVGEDDGQIENWRPGMCLKCGATAIKKTGNICQAHQDIEDAIVAPCNQCGAPTPAKVRHRHVGRCKGCYKGYLKERREENAKTRGVEHTKQKEPRPDAKKNGRPRIEVDLVALEDLLADPDLTIAEVGERLGIKPGVISYRRDHHLDFAEVWDRGLARREATRQRRRQSPGGNTTSSITKRYGPFCRANCFPDDKLGHHMDCAYWKEAEARRSRTAQNAISEESKTEELAPQFEQAKALSDNPQEQPQNITKVITNPETFPETETVQPERSQVITMDISKDKTDPSNPANKISAIPTNGPIADNLDSIETSKEAMAKERNIIPELSGQETQMVTRQTEIHGSLVLREEVQLKVEEIAQWPAERIAEFFEAVSKIAEIPSRPSAPDLSLITPQQLIDRFNTLNDGEIDEFFTKMNSKDKNVHWGVIDYPRPKEFYETGYQFLTELLDPYMKEDEQQAIWLLLRYLKKQEKSA